MNKENLPLNQLKIWNPSLNILGTFPSLQPYFQSYDLPSPSQYQYGNCFFETRQATFRVRLFAQLWKANYPLGTIFFVHGYHEHAGNYSRLIRFFLESHYSVAVLDLRGHGLSEGTRGHLEKPTCYVEDLEQWIEIALPMLPSQKPIYLWGHSLGGQICLQYLLRKKQKVTNDFPEIKAVCLSSPMLGFPALSGFRKILFQLTPLVSKVLPLLPVPTGFERGAVSSDEEYLKNRETDPLIKNTTTPLWVLNTLKNINWLQENATLFDNGPPVLLMLAGEEKVTSLVDARNFAFHAFKSIKHKIIEFPGIRHELEKEPAVRERVLRESVAWFASHS